MVVIGRHCNKKYRTEMETIFAVVEELQKKLNRPIKDLDDIRIAMAALKEIREQQISTDFQVGPIEVDGQLVCYRNISTPWMLSAGVNCVCVWMTTGIKAKVTISTLKLPFVGNLSLCFWTNDL